MDLKIHDRIGDVVDNAVNTQRGSQKNDQERRDGQYGYRNDFRPVYSLPVVLHLHHLSSFHSFSHMISKAHASNIIKHHCLLTTPYLKMNSNWIT
jgi:hypothetical protein